MNSREPRREDGTADDGLGPALAEAVDRLRFAEPAMPDLLGPAMAEGVRIRHRRRTTILFALTVAVVVLTTSVVGALAYLGGGQEAGPAAGGSPASQRPWPSGSADPKRDLMIKQFAEAIDKALPKAQLGVDSESVTVASRPDGRTVYLTLRDRQGRAVPIALSTGHATSEVRTADPGVNCEVPAKVDQTPPLAYTAPGVGCRTAEGVPASKERRVWDVFVKPVAPGELPIGAVRIGTDRQIVRAWTYDASAAGASAAEASAAPDRLRLTVNVLATLVDNAPLAAFVRGMVPDAGTTSDGLVTPRVPYAGTPGLDGAGKYTPPLGAATATADLSSPPATGKSTAGSTAGSTATSGGRGGPSATGSRAASHTP
ncbi:hypothetical protein [Yinghuangia seranimata]|uniref:hypothetical protein n=1 Tax=Yinghuangia seranimata TaxID=408067 RepID=UPI00248B2761|nr:hypothetical protein [Yinghuangia seranimata]MDI2132538.1 hypothetical protein [Yinghuangia seranimata]